MRMVRKALSGTFSLVLIPPLSHHTEGTFKEQPELLKSYLLFLSCIITKNAQHIITKENAPRNMFELGIPLTLSECISSCC